MRWRKSPPTPIPFQTTMIFSQVGGAIKDIPNDATAYANRSAQQQMVYSGAWPEPLEAGTGVHRDASANAGRRWLPFTERCLYKQHDG